MRLHIVEPTLHSFAGHCHSLVEALARAMPAVEVHIWAARGAQACWSGPGHLHAWFLRPLRRLQAVWLYRKLLASDDKILVATAGSSDFLTLDWLCKQGVAPGQVYLYVHWLGAKARRMERLRAIALRQPHLEILAPTDSVADFFRSLGFRSTQVPYPVGMQASDLAPPGPFRRLVVAGAARMDKGFDHIVDLVQELGRTQATLPLVVQASATHRDRHPPEIARLIERLSAMDYAPLELLTNTLAPQEYRALFAGGISVQPYSSSAFEDRVSGVTLDALCAGCPVVVTAGTWLARLVEQHRAGIATSDLSPIGLRTAIDAVLADYPAFAARARAAGQALQAAHSSGKMVDMMFSPAPGGQA